MRLLKFRFIEAQPFGAMAAYIATMKLLEFGITDAVWLLASRLVRAAGG